MISIRSLFFGLAALAIAGTAQAATIDFEGEPEYADAAALYSASDGVFFYLINGDDGTMRTRAPQIAVEANGDVAAFIVGRGPYNDDWTPYGDALLSDGGTFDRSHYGATFDAPVDFVSVEYLDFGDCIPATGSGVPVTIGLEAYDADGVVVDSDSVTAPYRWPDGAVTYLQVAGPDIVRVETFGDPDCGNGIDAFTYELQDSDDDGIPDVDDACPESIPDAGNVAVRRLGTNRWADLDGDGVFETTAPKGKGPLLSFDIYDTAGCTCADIIEAHMLGNGHVYFGCSISAMQDWISQL